MQAKVSVSALSTTTDYPALSSMALPNPSSSSSLSHSWSISMPLRLTHVSEITESISIYTIPSYFDTAGIPQRALSDEDRRNTIPFPSVE